VLLYIAPGDSGLAQGCFYYPIPRNKFISHGWASKGVGLGKGLGVEQGFGFGHRQGTRAKHEHTRHLYDKKRAKMIAVNRRTTK
jgi:hypothetical protein